MLRLVGAPQPSEPRLLERYAIFDKIASGGMATVHLPGLSHRLDEVTLRGLSIDPKDRFPTARDMARALEQAIPLASASTIGEWVEVAARATLDHREDRIHAIESSSGQYPGHPDERVPAKMRMSQRPAGTAAGDDVLSIASDEFTQLSSGSVSDAGRGAASAEGRRRSTLLLTLSGLAMGGLIAGSLRLIVLRVVPRHVVTRDSTATVSTSSPRDVPSAPPVPAKEIAPLPVLIPSVPVASIEPARSTASPSTTDGSKPATATVSPNTAATRRSVPQGSQADSCKPPFYYDAQGLRVFRKECL